MAGAIAVVAFFATVDRTMSGGTTRVAVAVELLRGVASVAALVVVAGVVWTRMRVGGRSLLRALLFGAAIRSFVASLLAVETCPYKAKFARFG